MMTAEIEWEVPGGGTHCWLVHFAWVEGEGPEIDRIQYHVGPGDRWETFPTMPYLTADALSYIERECETVWLDRCEDRAVEARASARD